METFMEVPSHNEIESGSIVFYIGNPNEAEKVTGGKQPATLKPKKPRAVVYQFFEWEKESARYKCKICEYANELCCGRLWILM